MEELAKQLGQVAVTAIASALERGLSRKEALEEAAAAISREEIVSDALWQRFEDYVQQTRDFEEHGA